MKKTVLITGGAGYVGSHTAFLMAANGYRVIIVDSLVHGQTFDHSWAQLIKADYATPGLLDALFASEPIDCVMHFAASIEVGESVRNPQAFYHNNVSKTLTLLDSMVRNQVRSLVFSSTCAVYGYPQSLPLKEDHQRSPVNPYGNTKLSIEYALSDYSAAYDFSYVALRYFNAAGALPERGLGEWHEPETHAIPVLLRAAREGRPFTVFGTDYPTPDGSCIRDYVHVCDLANAHLKAVRHLETTAASDVFNLGTGTGHSVLELVEAVGTVVGKKVQARMADRRAGDPPVLVADHGKATLYLGWEPKYSTLDYILSSAWKWELERQGMLAAREGRAAEVQESPEAQ